jgi:hypothetical protein
MARLVGCKALTLGFLGAIAGLSTPADIESFSVIELIGEVEDLPAARWMAFGGGPFDLDFFAPFRDGFAMPKPSPKLDPAIDAVLRRMLATPQPKRAVAAENPIHTVVDRQIG